jgi:hypothetical protein
VNLRLIIKPGGRERLRLSRSGFRSAPVSVAADPGRLFWPSNFVLILLHLCHALQSQINIFFVRFLPDSYLHRVYEAIDKASLVLARHLVAPVEISAVQNSVGGRVLRAKESFRPGLPQRIVCLAL